MKGKTSRILKADVPFDGIVNITSRILLQPRSAASPMQGKKCE